MILKPFRSLRSFSVAAMLGALSGLASGPGLAALPVLADRPLFLVQGATPNFILTIDDGVDLSYSFMPNWMTDSWSKRTKSSAFNLIYYNPDKSVSYDPPVDANGKSLGNADFRKAWLDGFDLAGRDTCTVDLKTNYRATWKRSGGPAATNINCDEVNGSEEYAWDPEHKNLPANPARDPNVLPSPAYYYVYDVIKTGCPVPSPTRDACYVRVEVGPEEEQRFANWFSYYRFKLQAIKTAATKVFAGVDDSIRIAYQTFQNQGDIAPAVPQPFSEGASRTDFFDWLTKLVYRQGSTPPSWAVLDLGTYLSKPEPYLEFPGDFLSDYYCRQNYHLLITDGWSNRIGFALVDEWDNQGMDLPAQEGDRDFGIDRYEPRPPYAAGPGIADFGDATFMQWVSDLRPGEDAPNTVPINIVKPQYLGDDGAKELDTVATFWDPENDPASWQHVSTYVIGLGNVGMLTPPAPGYPDESADGGDYPALVKGEKAWTGDGIDDLWHAAINGRGKFASAQNSQQLVEALEKMMPPLPPKEPAGSAALGQNSGTVTVGSKLYQARFFTGSWVGQVIAWALDASGNIKDTAEWDSADIFNGSLDADARRIATFEPVAGEGVAFRWKSLTDAQQALLDLGDGRGAARLDYLRGDRSQEYAQNGPFRDRLWESGNLLLPNLLGDIINSSPLYVGAPARFYPDDLEKAKYSDFRTAKAGRLPLVYFGANDGMLHALDAEKGDEVFAYIPGKVFANLAKLTDPTYAHGNYVDGPLTEGDLLAEGAWKTLLVGTLGGGGHGLFALDVTDPTINSEDDVAERVRWEFTDADDADLGNQFGRPNIVKLGKPGDGEWFVIFGNGYNNTAADGEVSKKGEAVLYVLDAWSGDLDRRISTGVGSSADPQGLDRPNGISAVTAVDIDADYITDYVYGGDLFGNLWRFDMTNDKAIKVFEAKDPDGARQPITTEPRVIRHPNGEGVMVLFGTGKYLWNGDASDIQVETWYGIWDDLTDAPALPGRDKLLQQEVLLQTTHESGKSEVRVTTNNAVNWGSHKGCYLDLPETGERVHRSPLVRNDRAIFVTVTPSTNPCTGGGTSWLMELDAKDCSRLDKESPFDFNMDGDFDVDDLTTYDAPGDTPAEAVIGSGIRIPGTGVYSAPSAIMIPGGEEKKYVQTATGDIIDINESTGLSLARPWREIR